MTSVERNIDDIRSCLDEAKVERYPLVNLLLAEKDEYIKSLYLCMLCVLIRYSGEISDMQSLYLRRLVAGIKAERNFKEYLKFAFDIGATEINEFVDTIKDDDLKYYFCLDGIIILSVTGSEDKQYGLLADIGVLLGISSKEFEYLAQVAIAIIEQDSNKINTVCDNVPDSIEHISFYQYLAECYKGAIVNNIINTHEEFYLYSPNRSKVTSLPNKIITAKRVVFENIGLILEEDIVFDGCKEVIIRNCDLVGHYNRFIFNCVDEVWIENCRINNFSQGFASFFSTNNIKFINNNIQNCGWTGGKRTNGGIISFDSHGRCDDRGPLMVIIENNRLYNCYVKCSEYDCNEHFRYATGIFVGYSWAWFDDNYLKEIRVIGNYFIGGRCINNGYKWKLYDDCYILLNSKTIHYEENNICSGGCEQIFGFAK